MVVVLQTEIEAIILGLRLSSKLNISNPMICSDSQNAVIFLIVPRLLVPGSSELFFEYSSMLENFAEPILCKIHRSENKEAHGMTKSCISVASGSECIVWLSFQ